MNVRQPVSVLSAHPVADDVRERVLDELAAIERRHDVQVIYACESGSRGWGFASPDSDYDVRFLYVHRLDWYLQVEAGRDVIELPINDELDVSGWELRKALQLLHRSNPTLLEWLDSPIVYRQAPQAMTLLRPAARDFFSPARGRHHYLSMAKKNFRGYLQGDEVRYKKYLYVLRPLLAVQWIDERGSVPPMRFADLVAGTVHEPALLDEINALLALKMQTCESEYGPRRPGIHALIEARLANAAIEPDHKRPQGEPALLDMLMRRIVLERWD